MVSVDFEMGYLYLTVLAPLVDQPGLVDLVWCLLSEEQTVRNECGSWMALSVIRHILCSAVDKIMYKHSVDNGG